MHHGITAESLGSAQFLSDYNLRCAYVAGSMYKGISSEELVIEMGQAGLLGFFGTGGLPVEQIEQSIKQIKGELCHGEPYGMNLLSTQGKRQLEMECAALYLRHGVRYVEASAYTQVAPSIVYYRLKGISRDAQGEVCTPNRVIAKISRPEVAAAFMRPAPEAIVASLVADGFLTQEEARLAKYVPVADAICVEADSGGHTDQGGALTLLPMMLELRDEAVATCRYSKPIHVGAAGGIGTPQATAAEFIMGADFVLTGSINQCTVEAGTSEPVKHLLQSLDVRDTTYAPAGDLFEMGAKVQVVKRGLMFPGRANKLYEIYQRHDSLESLDASVRRDIEEKYFQRPMSEVWREACEHLAARPEEVASLERNPKQKMARIFKWYFAYTGQLALRGSPTQKLDYQIHCGPALGAFNRWVKGTYLEDWRNRHVAEIGGLLMREAADVLNARLASLARLPRRATIPSSSTRHEELTHASA
jgi:trans-AT polyketide synthase/acyltransferase/oxidoreductase domain-containing protein